ncbi:MAG: hypothetical protein JXK07_02905 [Spirochaetes bacterium]|nr:hypothetical protein [Spirochaetota bacterium]MBN2770994.1 hypothetical protein [Spirochaetota bacterium]
MNNRKINSSSITIPDVETAEQIISKLKGLSSFIIDTSSLIYMNGISALNKVAQAYRIKAPVSVINEFGSCPEGISTIDINLSADDDLLACAGKLGLPVCSEDKRVLLHARRSNIDYYNTIMILVSMRTKNIITKQEFGHYITGLRSNARYSEKVWDYAQKLIDTVNMV